MPNIICNTSPLQYLHQLDQLHQLPALALTGTLDLLLDAKRAGLISAVGPLLDQLQALRFFVSAETRVAILKIVEEV